MAKKTPAAEEAAKTNENTAAAAAPAVDEAPPLNPDEIGTGRVKSLKDLVPGQFYTFSTGPGNGNLIGGRYLGTEPEKVNNGETDPDSGAPILTDNPNPLWAVTCILQRYQWERVTGNVSLAFEGADVWSVTKAEVLRLTKNG